MEHCTDCGREGVELWALDVPTGQPLTLYCASCLIRIFSRANIRE